MGQSRDYYDDDNLPPAQWLTLGQLAVVGVVVGAMFTLPLVFAYLIRR